MGGANMTAKNKKALNKAMKAKKEGDVYKRQGNTIY